MNKYECGKIYKLVSEHTNKCYIGSTCDELHRRFSMHKARHMGGAKELFDMGDVTIQLIEHFACKTRIELRNREREIIMNTDNTTNIRKPFKNGARDNNEKLAYMKKRYADNPNIRERTKEQSKKWKEDNKDRYQRKCKEYAKVKVTCECGSITSKKHLNRHLKTNKHKKYINNNKE